MAVNRNTRRCWGIAQRAGGGYKGKHQCTFRARYVFEDGNTQMHVCGTHRRKLERWPGKWRLAAELMSDGTVRVL